MQLLCNGEAWEVPLGFRVADCLRQLDLDASSVVVECDGKIIPKDEYESHELQDGSVLELIRFVGGG